MQECGGFNQTTCQEYLKLNTNILNLTIKSIIESNEIVLKNGSNYITSDKFNLSMISKGSVPIIRLGSGLNASNLNFSVKKNNDFYPDYVVYNLMSLSDGNLIGFTNITKFNESIGSPTSNIDVQLKFTDPILINLTRQYAYLSFSSYQPFLYTQYSGNYIGNPNANLIMVRNIDTYPFKSIKFIHL